jgi:23S rRNA pseudouridine1911/1915/1917 synthase
VKKKYLALVHGRMKQEKGRIQLPVARDRVRRTRMTTRRRDGRAADTAYRVLETSEGFSLLEVDLHTGRTHQIRVHLASLSRPVVGDKLYGASGTLRWGNHSRPTLNRNFLHAVEIEFLLPGTEKTKKVRAPMPEELLGLLQEMGFRFPKTD